MSATVFEVSCTPRASKERIKPPLADGRWKVYLTAPPVDDAANAALVALLARCLGVRRADVEIVAGHTSRKKRIAVRGIDADALRVLLSRSSEET